MSEPLSFPTSLGTSTADEIRLLGQDLTADLMGKVGFGELAFWLVALAEELGLAPVVESGGVPGVRNPITFSGTPASYELPPPGLDDDCEEIRAWLTKD